MEALKEVYSPVFYDKLADTLAELLPGFDKKKFLARTFNENFKDKELKDRMRHTTAVVHEFMPAEFGKAAKLIGKWLGILRKGDFSGSGLAFLFLPDYIETYGLDDYDAAVKAIEQVTQFISCEFAVRPFLIKYGDAMIAQMLQWSLHKNASVRRLASEGSRPRLPWAMAIPALKKDPSPILPILENLKNDTSESVRRSVANSLNDIAKDHPDVVLKIAKKWKGKSPETDAIIKHGSRTLLKQGHEEILKHYGLNHNDVAVTGLKIIKPKIRVGDSLEFTFTITNKNDAPQKIRLEYAIFYKRQAKEPSKKVFKISEKVYAPNEQVTVARKQKFVPITTRRFYAGAHRLSVIVNGVEKMGADFDLQE